MTVTARQSPEVLVDLITTQIKNNIGAALAALRTDRNDPRISTALPRTYFISEYYDPYELPAIFVLCEEVDWQKEQKGANFVTGKAAIKVFCVVESENTEMLTRALYRYEAALQVVLDQVGLTSSNSKVKMTVVVNRSRFSTVYRAADKAKPSFRREVVLECDVLHYETF